VLVRRVVEDEFGDHADAPVVGLAHESAEVPERSVARMNQRVVRNVVPIVAQRRVIERQQPYTVDAELLEVGQLLHQTDEVAVPIAVAVPEGFYVHFVDDRVFVPLRGSAHRAAPRSTRRT
jgi:hypothetical protein